MSFDDVIMSLNAVVIWWRHNELQWMTETEMARGVPPFFLHRNRNRQNRDFPDSEYTNAARRNDVAVDVADDDADACDAMRCRRCVRTQNFASIRRLQEHACKYIRVGSRVLDSLVVFWRVFRAGTKKVGKKVSEICSSTTFLLFLWTDTGPKMWLQKSVRVSTLFGWDIWCSSWSYWRFCRFEASFCGTNDISI